MSRDIDAEMEQIIAEVKAELDLEYQEIAAARGLPTVPGRCPGTGLKTTSAGAYEVVVCSVCYAILGPWDWDVAFAPAVEHDRRIAD